MSWAIVFLCVAALLCFTAIAIVHQLVGRAYRGASNQEEAKLVQEIHAGLMKMEKRIDALETIILEHDQKHSEKS